MVLVNLQTGVSRTVLMDAVGSSGSPVLSVGHYSLTYRKTGVATHKVVEVVTWKNVVQTGQVKGEPTCRVAQVRLRETNPGLADLVLLLPIASFAAKERAN